jgi:transcriptional regulator with PAS, ATPase and Fis domain
MLMNRPLEALSGFEQEEARGVPCAYILRSNLCLHQCPALKVAQTLEPVSIEGDIVSKNREKIPVRVTIAPLQDSESNLVGYLETVEDIRLLRELSGQRSQAYGYGSLIGRSSQMERVFQMLPAIAQTDSSVLITGETGTGKDLVAEALHQASARAKGPFVKVNCGALPEALLESELFGHRKGAFTGAVESKPGRFRLAHTGTLYLTEIGDLPLPLQVKLLTFLDDKIVYPLGSTKGVQVDVRVVAGTHRNLERMVREGRFREDLLFRLNVVRLQLPPLRERGEDIRLLLDHFLHTFSEQFNKPIKGFSKKALDILLAYSYPGNVRELRNIVEYAVNICSRERVEPEALPSYILEAPAAEEAPPESAGREAERRAAEGGETSGFVAGDESWAATERRMILEALVKAKGKRSEAAALLGWGRSTLWRKMKQYNIDR